MPLSLLPTWVSRAVTRAWMPFTNAVMSASPWHWAQLSSSASLSSGLTSLWLRYWVPSSVVSVGMWQSAQLRKAACLPCRTVSISGCWALSRRVPVLSWVQSAKLKLS